MTRIGFVLAGVVLTGCAARGGPHGASTATTTGPVRATPEPLAGASDARGGDAVNAAAQVERACHPRDGARACLEGGLAQFGRSTGEAHFEERPARAARLHTFELDRDEVTVEAYARCVEAGRCRPAQCDDGSAPPTQGPARCVAWADARAFCEHAGGRLLSEAEWERAAAGLLPEHRQYPWGEHAEPGDGGALAVRDETPEGVRALGGGVAEWVDDVGAFYLLPPRPDAGVGDASTDASAGEAGAGDGGVALADAAVADATVATAANPPSSVGVDTSERELGGTDGGASAETTDGGLVVVDDPRGPADGPWRVVRGGNDEVPIAQWTTTRRRFRQPEDRRPWIGFRCAYAPAD